MWPAGEFLAGDAGSYDVFRISHCGWPVEPCSKSLGHECATARVMFASAFVDLEQQGFAVFFLDALLEDLRDVALVELSVDYCERFGSSADASGFCDVLRKSAFN